MSKAIIIDDEVHCIETLKEKINIYCPSIEIVAFFNRPQLAIDYLETNNPDIVFLDIEMPVINGFSLLEKVKQIKFKVVFTTAYDQYALKAIKFSAFDYLLKPIDKDDLILISEKINSQKDFEPVRDQMDVLMQQIKNTNAELLKISLPTADGIFFPLIKDIIRVESSSNYSTLFFANRNKIMVSRTLKEFEEMLGQHGFFRIHNSHLINLNKIEKISKGDGYQVDLENGDVIEISRRRKEEFLKMYKSIDVLK